MQLSINMACKDGQDLPTLATRSASATHSSTTFPSPRPSFTRTPFPASSAVWIPNVDLTTLQSPKPISLTIRLWHMCPGDVIISVDIVLFDNTQVSHDQIRQFINGFLWARQIPISHQICNNWFRDIVTYISKDVRFRHGKHISAAFTCCRK